MMEKAETVRLRELCDRGLPNTCIPTPQMMSLLTENEEQAAEIIRLCAEVDRLTNWSELVKSLADASKERAERAEVEAERLRAATDKWSKRAMRADHEVERLTELNQRYAEAARNNLEEQQRERWRRRQAEAELARSQEPDTEQPQAEGGT